MMTFLPPFLFDMSASQAAPDAPAPSLTEEGLESTGDEFAALFALLWMAPAATPVEQVVTDASSAEKVIIHTETSPTDAALPPTNGNQTCQYSLADASSILALEETARQEADSITSFAKPTIKYQTGETDKSIDHFINESPAGIELTDRPDRVDSSASERQAEMFDFSRIDSLVSAKPEVTAVSITPIKSAFDKDRPNKNEFPKIDLDEAIRYEGRPERAVKGSILETAFRDIISAKPEVRPEIINEAPILRESLVARTALRTNDGLPVTGEDYVQPDDPSQTDAPPPVTTVTSATVTQERADTASTATMNAIAQQVVNPIIDVAKRLAQRETRTLRMELQPERFGHIDVKVTRGSDGQLSAHMVADLDVAHQALSEGMNHLRRALEQSGLAVDRLEVTLSLDAGGSSGSHTARESDTMPTHLAGAGLFSSEAAMEDEDHTARDDQNRLLSLRI